DCRRAIEEIRLVTGWLSDRLHEESAAHSAAAELNNQPVSLSLVGTNGGAPPAPARRPLCMLGSGGFKLVAPGILGMASLGLWSLVRFTAKPRAELTNVATDYKARSLGEHFKIAPPRPLSDEAAPAMAPAPAEAPSASATAPARAAAADSPASG